MTTSNDTLFLPKVTPITSAWLQPVNDVVFKGKDINFGTTTGSANAHVLTLAAPSLYQGYAPGDTFTFIAGYTNTNLTVTLSVVGASTLPAVQLYCQQLGIPIGTLLAGNVYTVTYDGTYFQLQSSPVAFGLVLLQYDVTSSRLVNTNYQNLTGKTMFVSIITTNASGSSYLMNGEVGSTTLTLVVQAATTVTTGSTEGVNTLIVPQGYYYNMTISGAGTATLAKWVELY